MKCTHLLAAVVGTLFTVGMAQAGEMDCYRPRPIPNTFWGRLCERLERHSCGYGKTHHDFGCTGCRADAIFVFGSSWDFFEEPCRRQTSWKK